MTMTAGESFLTDVTRHYVSDIGQSYTRTVGADARVSAAGSSLDTTGKVKMIEAHERLHLRCGTSEMVMEPDGTITIKGSRLIVQEEALMKVTAGKIELN